MKMISVTEQNDKNCSINKVIPINNDVQKHESDKGVSFEDALNKTGVGKYNIALLFISVFTLLSASAENFSVAILLAASQCDLELDTYKKGIIGSVPMLGVIASAHLWGFIADTKGRKFALLVSTSGTFLMAVVSSFATNWTFLAVAKFFSAACGSGTNAVIYAMLGENTPNSHRGRYLLFTSCAVMSSIGVNSVIAYPILNLTFSYYISLLGITFRPWRLLAQLYGCFSAISMILLALFSSESAKFHFAKGNYENGYCTLQKIYAINTGKSRDDYTVKSVHLEEEVGTEKSNNFFVSVWNQTAPLFQKQHIFKTLLLAYLNILVFSVGPPFSVWIPVILDVYSRNLDTNQTFCQLFENLAENSATLNSSLSEVCNDDVADFTILGLTAFSVYLTLANLIVLILVSYLGKKQVFIGFHIISACMGFLLNHIYNVWGIVPFSIMLSSSVCMGVTTTYSVELFPTYLRAMGMCLTMMIGRGFSFIVINLIGHQLENNCEPFMYYFATFIATAVLAGLLLPAEKKKPT